MKIDKAWKKRYWYNFRLVTWMVCIMSSVALFYIDLTLDAIWLLLFSMIFYKMNFEGEK